MPERDRERRRWLESATLSEVMARPISSGSSSPVMVRGRLPLPCALAGRGDKPAGGLGLQGVARALNGRHVVWPNRVRPQRAVKLGDGQGRRPLRFAVLGVSA